MSAATLPLNKFAAPELVYRSERVELWQGDSRDVLRPLPMGAVADLLIADPPYGQEWQSDLRSDRFDVLHGDRPADRESVRDVLAAAIRVLRQNRHLYVFGPAGILDGLKATPPVELIWDKATKGAGDLASPWGPQHERISFAVGKHRRPNQEGRGGLPARLRKGSVIRFPRPSGSAVRHPAEKPVALHRELIESSSRAGELVLDPFAGIGSTGVAAVLTGRRALLVEIDAGYCQIAADRLRAAEAIVDKAVGL